MSIGTKLYLKLFCTKVGQDNFGNEYFVSKCKNNENKFKRIIWYKGTPEPSKVPPMWHAWLHYTTDEMPKSASYSWQVPHMPNFTGTELAYKPHGHLQAGGKRPKATGDYEPWKLGDENE